MRRFGELLQCIGILGSMLFASGADMNEISVTLSGIGGFALMVAAGAGFAKIGRFKRNHYYNLCRWMTSSTVLVIAAALVVSAFKMPNTAPEEPEQTLETAAEPITIEIHSEQDANESETLSTERETETPVIEIQTSEEIQAENEAAGFVYLKELPLTFDQQELLYNIWTGAGFDYITALALADQETGGTFDITAVNDETHDYGLFQLNKASWDGTFKRELGIRSWDEMMDYEMNIRGAVYVYGDCVDRYGETERSVVAYQMGSAKYDSTKYSRSVLEKYRKWAEIYNAARRL